MTGFLIGVLASVVSGAVVNEMCDLSPWLARRAIRLAARIWTIGGPDAAAVYEEEWAAVIEDCPGRLTKLALAMRFLASAIMRVEQHG